VSVLAAACCMDGTVRAPAMTLSWRCGCVNKSTPALRRLGLEHAARHLVPLDRFEERLEVALAEALVPLALDDLEEDRADHRLGEDLQKNLALLRRPVDQDLVAREPLAVLAVARKPLVQRVIVSARRRLEGGLARTQRLHGPIDVVGAQCYVLYAFAMIGDQVFLDLRLVVRGFVDGNADLAVGAGHGLALQSRELALDVEVADLAEVKEPFV